MNDTKDLLHKELIKACTIRSCLNCDNFNEVGEMCNLAPAFNLPAKVIVYGCPKWIQFIPF